LSLLRVLPLADPPQGSLGRLTGQCPGLIDITCAIDVGVVFVAAMRAYELRLVDPAGLVDDTAFGTRLRGVGRIDINQLTTALGELVVEHPCEHAPALIEDQAVESALCLDVGAGLGDGALGATGHFLNLQFFDLDYAVALGEIGRELVQKILSRIRRPHVQTADLGLLFLPISRKLGLACELTLCLCEPTLDRFDGIQRLNLRAVAERRKHRDTSIQPNRRQRWWRRIGDLGPPCNAGIPVSAPALDCDSAQFAAKRPIAQQLYPTDLRQFQRAPVLIEALKADMR